MNHPFFSTLLHAGPMGKAILGGLLVPVELHTAEPMRLVGGRAGLVQHRDLQGTEEFRRDVSGTGHVPWVVANSFH